ncbi:hypothetical protein [Chachezhania sediminis]|nr:hypothetical protein [Chachezhania sediminis]
MDAPLLFAEVICATALGFSLFLLGTLIGRALLGYWQESAR